MIDVIIPAYNAHDTIDETLKSIEKQTLKDKIKVYLVDDHSDKDYNYLNGKYNLDLTIYRLDKNSGPGVAREYGIEHSNGEYIVFIDSDDIFTLEDSIEYMLKTIGDADVGTTSFVEETDNGYNAILDTNVWLHGKIYRRKYIEENNIYFNDTYHSEDYEFNRLLMLSGAKINSAYEFTYMWKNNKNSITRANNNEFEYTGLFGYIYNALWVLNESIKRNYSPYLIGFLAYETLIYMYINYVIYNETKDMSSLLSDCKKVLDIYNKYKIEDEERVYDEVYNKYKNMITTEIKISFEGFINKISCF